MNQPISENLSLVRKLMQDNKIDALIIPSEDEYLGEYVPSHNQRLKWATGFTGSAGVAILLKDSATIFVDGRYTVQVRQQVSSELFNFMHLHEDPQVEWLSQQLKAGSKVGFDSRLHSYQWYLKSKKTLDQHEIQLVDTQGNLVDKCWSNKPAVSTKPMLLVDEVWTGRPSLEKRAAIGQAISKAGADAAIIFSAESCNWLLNIRGQDIPSLPVVLGAGILHSDGNMQFHLNKDKIIKDTISHVGDRVEFLSEEEYGQSLQQLAGKRVLLDHANCNAFSALMAIEKGAILVEHQDPVLLPKATKNRHEIAGMREAHIQDAVAEIGFIHWFEQQIEQGHRLSEAELSDQLFDFRAQQPSFVEVSFDTISAAGGNAAMCHYNHRNSDLATNLPDNGLYLVDSGGQYHCGTTDITRTLAVGTPSEEIKQRFTLVLKGHIALDQIVFPEGTTGTQLDTLARMPLWQQGLDYDHGTGHGVGHFMSVHEGPHRISKKSNDVALEPGMIVSNEPGYYKDGAYGIRCENLVVVEEAIGLGQEGRKFLKFSPLTMVPFDKKMMDISLLTDAEIDWINGYHQTVLTHIGPKLEGELFSWLKQATSPI